MPNLVIEYFSQVANSMAHALYSYEQDRIIAITCMYWQSHRIGFEQCKIVIPSLFLRIWQSPYPTRTYYKNKWIDWSLREASTGILPNRLGFKTPVRQQVFRFTLKDRSVFSSEHYLN